MKKIVFGALVALTANFNPALAVTYNETTDGALTGQTIFLGNGVNTIIGSFAFPGDSADSFKFQGTINSISVSFDSILPVDNSTYTAFAFLGSQNFQVTSTKTILMSAGEAVTPALAQFGTEFFPLTSAFFVFEIGAGPIGQISGATVNYTITIDGNLSALPEPSTWAMMILGFAGIGFMTYSKRRRLALLYATGPSQNPSTP